MSEQPDIEAAMVRFARSHLALNSKVVALIFDEPNGVWIGTSVGSTGSHRLMAREQGDGTWKVWRYQGTMPAF